MIININNTIKYTCQKFRVNTNLVLKDYKYHNLILKKN